MKFKLFGTDFSIEYSFLLILSFGLLFGCEDIVSVLLYSSLHEMGHIAALCAFSGHASSITLSYYGLALKYDSELTTFKEIIVLISGPLVNLILYLLFKDEINLLLFIINMLPVYPIDFGRIIYLFNYNLSKYLSAVFIVLLLILSVYLIVKNHSFSLLFITCYLIFYSINY